MLSSLDTLYNMLPLDTTLRKHKLASVCRHSNVPMQMLLSFRVHRKFTVSVTATINNTLYSEDDVRYILYKIIKSASKKEMQHNIRLLSTNHQIVLKHLLLETFNYSVIINEIPKLYLMKDIEGFLFSHRSDRLYYIIHNSKKLDYTFRGQNTIYSSIKNKIKRPNVPSSMCVLTDNGNIVAMGDKSLYKFIKGASAEFTLINELKYANSEQELQQIMDTNKGKYITTFGTEMVTKYIPVDMITVSPLDWLVDDSFNVIGYIIEHNKKTYNIKHVVSKKLFDYGLNVNLVVEHGIHNGKLTKLVVKEVRLKE